MNHNLSLSHQQSTHTQVYFPGFLQNELYYKFLTELINTVKPEHNKPNRVLGGGTTQSNADADSRETLDEHKSQNTLLAEGNVKKLFDESDLSIDWGTLNPDSLWHRPDSG